METVEQHFKKLPLQIRLKAMENTRLQTKCSFKKKLSIEVENLWQALQGSFVFSATREGFEFWFNVIIKYKK